MIDIAIIGAGAAGLMASIFAGRRGEGAGRSLRVVAFDGAARLGAKILISGGGRCNVTNQRVEAADFNGGNRNLIARVLRTFDVPATVEFFGQLGVGLKTEETGKLFPVTDRARTVLDALLRAASQAGVELRSRSRIESIRKEEDRFVLSGPDFTEEAGRIVLSTGGRSVPKSGSDGAGYEMAMSLGHSVTPVFPALVPLVLERNHWLTALSGVSCDAELRVVSGTGRGLAKVKGSLLFTHFGLSGPATLDISRHWIDWKSKDPDARLEVALVGLTDAEIESRLIDARDRGRATVGSTVRAWLPDRLAAAVCEQAALVRPDLPVNRLTREERRRIALAVTVLPLPAIANRGFDYAEVTAGGVPLAEVDVRTMESKLCPGLFLCGEILDVDGRIGGFNFQWAWASGRLAGIGALAR